jgi:hypothetical protein
MYKKRFNLRMVAMIVACLAVTTMFFSCDLLISSDKQITSFKFTTPLAVGVINENAKTITVEVPKNTDVTLLVPTITISEYATISPNSNVAQNFTYPVSYTVTAEDGSTANYIVTVTVANSGGGV